MGMRLDHLAVSAATLDDGAAAVASVLGVTPGPGGRHPYMGTHNRLLSLGPGEYLEIIAIDPDARAPGRPRWFGLDAFSGPPRLTSWILACDDLDAALARAPEGAGQPVALERGAYRWRMGVAPSGLQPFGDAFPPLIEWRGPHPAVRLPDHGLRLAALEIVHPEAAALAAALDRLGFADPRLTLREGPARAFRAEIFTPDGARILT